MIMFAGCALCGKAAGTSTFQPAGNEPKAWIGNVVETDLNDALIGELDNYQTYITDNGAIITKHAKYLRNGLRLGFASPIVLALTGMAFFYLH
jgi:hypothetical protein